MRLKVNSELSHLVDQVRSCLGEAETLHIVGGGVRDLLLGRKLHDLDFAMPVNPTRLAKCVANQLGAGFFILDDERHTARVLYINSEGDPFPLDFVQYTGTSLQEDLQNRDFTVNAMAILINDLSTVIDPLDGQLDLQEKVLRVCQQSSLRDDPVRVLRGVRLAIQFGFMMDADLEGLMCDAAAHLPETSYERQRDELFKILDGPDPASGMAFLQKSCVMPSLFPALIEQESIPASPPHVLPLFEHTLTVLRYYAQLLKNLQNGISSNEESEWWMQKAVRELNPFSKEITELLLVEVTPGRKKRSLALLGALLHDVGKPRTMTVGEDGCLHYFGHDSLGADLAWEAAKRLQLSNAESAWIRTMVRYHMRLLPLTRMIEGPDRKSVYRFFKRTGEVGAAIALLSLADTAATYGENLVESNWDRAVGVSKSILSAWFNDQASVISPTLLLNGDDLQELFGLPQGKRIGKLLAALEEGQASGTVTTRDEAQAFIQERLTKGLEVGNAE